MKHPKNILMGISQSLQIPTEILPDVPKITMQANTEVYIENYAGIHSYQEDEVAVKTALGIFFVRGTGLRIERMNRSILSVCGRIVACGYLEELACDR